MRSSATRLLTAIAIALALSAAPVHGQVLRGVVLAAEDNSPIRGAFVVLIDSTGRERGASLSDELGRFRIQAPEAGSYHVRWELVGRPVDISETFQLVNGEERSIRVMSFTRPQTLMPVQVAAASSCPSNPQSEQVTALWLEVTKVLRVSQWSIDAERMRFDVEIARREWDPHSLTLLGESRERLEDRIGRPFESVSPDFLSANGYVVLDEGEHYYFAPDEKSLLSNTFIGEHCLSLAEPRPDMERYVGIAFEPAPNRSGTDIAGVFWLNKDSNTLRFIDYRYSGLERFEMHRLIGGTLEFERVESGEWYISSWSIRMPQVTLCRGTGIFGFLTRRNRPCLAGITEVTGEVLDLRIIRYP